MATESLDKLIQYCEKVALQGYDPYDTLNSPILNIFPGNFLPSVFIQLQKRNPVNLRPLLGIKKGYNPKAMGLFLKAYCLLYEKTKQGFYLEKAHVIFNWLQQNYSKGFSGYAWGYNFDWASPGNYLKAYTPSVVVTSFVIDGVYKYYLITKKEDARNIILSAALYIRKDIPTLDFDKGISFSYTHLSKGACYNASLLAAEVLAKANALVKNVEDMKKVKKAISYVLSKQKNDGSWLYSYNPETDTERHQIDFHQGFILTSLNNLMQLTDGFNLPMEDSIKKGLVFYQKHQFEANGKSLWRLPKKWPVDIHNQSQGVITFSQLNKYNNEYLQVAEKILLWTIEHMQDKRGYFYYRNYKNYKNKIPFIRWSQAWMLLAMSEFLSHTKD